METRSLQLVEVQGQADNYQYVFARYVLHHGLPHSLRKNHQIPRSTMIAHVMVQTKDVEELAKAALGNVCRHPAADKQWT